MAIQSRVYLGLPTSPSEILDNGDFELVTGDNFDDWTETTAAGSEMLSNGDFELVTGDDFDDWVEGLSGTGTCAEEGTEKHGGSHSIKLTGTNTSNTGWALQTLTTTVGKVYKVTVWTKGDYQFTLNFADYPKGTAADWTKIEYYFTAVSTSTLFYILTNEDTGGTAYFDDISVMEEYTSIEDEGTIVNGGSHAVKLIGAGTVNSSVDQTVTTTAETLYSLSFYSKGDGTSGIEYTIYDVTNSAEIDSGTAPVSTDWAKTTVPFDTPASCVSVKITLEADGPGPFYLDDASVLEYSDPVFTENNDVNNMPALTWEYGIKGSGPMNLVATTGIATFTLDNEDKKYSPEGGERVVGFEEGMDVKITVSADFGVTKGDSDVISNGDFET